MEAKSIAELSAELAAGQVTSVELVDAYLHRIASLDDAGPKLNAVLALNPRAREEAAALDAERAQRGPRGPLHGIPILVKDNIETEDPIPTTAGSLALRHNLTRRDAPIVARLRAAGAFVLGKTNLSEWANVRSTKSISGWSAVGGLTRNPHSLDRTACGSSAGSGAAVASSLAAAALGTDTAGSILCPAAVMGVVGLRPTVGLLSRRHIVPISRTQDSPGALGRSVIDVATLLSAMAGSDPQDHATAPADEHKRDYVAALHPDALRGKRLGVLRAQLGKNASLDAEFAEARALLEEAGAELVDVTDEPPTGRLQRYQDTILLTELKVALDAYLSAAPPEVEPRTLAELIAFNERHAAVEMEHFNQELFHIAQQTKGLDNPRYQEVVRLAKRAAGPEGIDAMLEKHQVSALIAPTAGRAGALDGDEEDASEFTFDATLAAVAGYPQLTVPMGEIGGLPVGLSFIGAAWSEADLLAFGHAFELRAGARVEPTYVETLGSGKRRARQIARRWLEPVGSGAALAALAGVGWLAYRRRTRSLSEGRSTETS